MRRDPHEPRALADDVTRTSDRGPRSASADVARLALAIVHADDAQRIGEIVFVPHAPNASAILGRGTSDEHLAPVRQRPAETRPGDRFDSPFLSRDQLRITRAVGGSLRVENIGKCALRGADGRDVHALEIGSGDAFALGEHLVLLCVERPTAIPRLRASRATSTSFGHADPEGIVGESCVAWALRDTIAFVAARAAHVLLLGPSGSGKEVAARAIHRLSPRRARAMVMRNASTLPSGLIEAELFGNAANYPSHGMPERPGLAGEANGSTLFLDEIGELTEELSTRLLRLLDDEGDYQRLGDSRRRSADLRVVGATNQPIGKLRADVAARFKLRIHLPGLDARREDIPLLARHLMQRIAAEDAEIADRFFEGGLADASKLRVAPDLMLRLVMHDYTTHVRELDALLWLSLSTSPGDVLALTPEVCAALGDDEGAARSETAGPSEATARTSPPTADEIRAALARAGGVHEKAWRDLGLASRYVLKRLVKKHGLATG